jgi:predicted O-methyltransferase YrrM
MTQQTWTAVDHYLEQTLGASDPALDAAVAASNAAGLPHIAVAPMQGKLLMILAQSIGAKRILEVGTLGGYSTIWLARALPPTGKLITLEYEARHAEVARTNVAHAGLANVVEVRVGAALDTLPSLAGEPAFDLVFIDADKDNYPGYLEWAIKLTHPGSMIIADNVVREGRVANSSDTDPRVVGVRRMHEIVASTPSLRATAIQTVGSKGYDGLLIATVQ